MLGDVFFVTCVHVVDKVPQPVKGQKEYIHYLRCGDHLPAANQPKDVFDLVGQILDVFKAHKTRSTLDGMGGPKYLVYQIFINVGPCLLNGQQIILDISQVFPGFLNIRF